MWEWKYWDIAIAVVGFFVQCGLAYMGLTLTHWKHKTAFFGLVLIGLVFTIFAVKRGVDSAQSVQVQLNTIQHNTETPPNVTVNNNIPSAQPPNVVIRENGAASLMLVPFYHRVSDSDAAEYVKQRTVNCSMDIWNLVPHVARNVIIKTGCDVGGVGTWTKEKEDVMWAKIMRSAKKDDLHDLMLGIQVNAPGNWDRHITEPEFQALSDKKTFVFYMTEVTYEDDSGSHRIERCTGEFYPRAFPNLVVGQCLGHNSFR